MLADAQNMRHRLHRNLLEYASRVDVLSDAIVAMRTGLPHSARTSRHGPWAVDHPPFAGAGFHVVLQGACWLFPPEGEPIRLGPGDVVFLPRGRQHGMADSRSTPLAGRPATSLAAIQPTDGAARGPAGPDRTTDPASATVLLCGAYLLDRSRSHPLVDELPEVIHLPARLGRHPALRAAVDLLGSELAQPRPGADAVVPALLDMLLLFTLRAWFDERSERDTAAGWAGALTDPAVVAALRAVHDNPGRQWTVAELGTRAGLSRAALARRFTALVGQPPLAYLTWWRMTLAARYLREGDAPLCAIADQVGYGSEFAFAHAFKREYGTAPGAYRHQAGRRHQAGQR